jgi:hypothetical protein
LTHTSESASPYRPLNPHITRQDLQRMGYLLSTSSTEEETRH